MIAMAATSYGTNLLCSAILDCFEKLGLLYHAHKCQLRAVSTLDHLGFRLDVKQHKFFLSTK
jgi:hypothetical protein